MATALRAGLCSSPYRVNFESEGLLLGPSRSWRVLVRLIGEPQQGVMGEGGPNSDFLTKDRSLGLTNHQAWSGETELLLKGERSRRTRV